MHPTMHKHGGGRASKILVLVKEGWLQQGQMFTFWNWRKQFQREICFSADIFYFQKFGKIYPPKLKRHGAARRGARKNSICNVQNVFIFFRRVRVQLCILQCINMVGGEQARFWYQLRRGGCSKAKCLHFGIGASSSREKSASQQIFFISRSLVKYIHQN